MKTKKKYIAHGYVWGQCWGGGECGYSAKELTDTSLKSIKNQITNGVKDGSLDSGMGFEKVTGALMNITCETIITVNKKEFINSESNYFEIGKINQELYDL